VKVRRYSEEVAHKTLDETASIFVSSAEVYLTNQSLLADVDASSWTPPQDYVMKSSCCWTTGKVTCDVI